MIEKSIESVLREYTSRLLALKGVTGVAIGRRRAKPCIRVYVIEKSAKLLEQIPSQLEGYTVVVEESGEFQALGI